MFAVKLAFHDADTDSLARIVARMSACRSCSLPQNNCRKLRVLDVSARILARMSVSWNVGLNELTESNDDVHTTLVSTDPH